MGIEDRPPFGEVVDLLTLCYQLSATERTGLVPGTNRNETVLEHSFSVAIIAWAVAERAAPHLDHAKLLKYAIVHDLVEIYAKDTFRFGSKEDLETKDTREAEGRRLLRERFPDFTGLHELIEAFETQSDEESQLVDAIEKMLPGIRVSLAEPDFWLKYGVTKEAFEAHGAAVSSSSEIVAPYVEEVMVMLSSHQFHVPNQTSNQA